MCDKILFITFLPHLSFILNKEKNTKFVGGRINETLTIQLCYGFNFVSHSF